LRVGLFNELNLPGARPLLQTLFALNSKFDLIELFEVDQAVHTVLLAKSIDRISAMLIRARRTRSLVTPM
jgi:hypothetical protein